ncbi:hypothetical protein PENTCL1PPCAC_16170, partial [Pristionchus entomophagus]
LCLILFTCAHSYKILVYIPKFAKSHINFMGKLADTLVDAGHDVTALISEMDAKLIDGTKKARIIRVSPAERTGQTDTHFMDSDIDLFEHDFDTYSATVENARQNAVSYTVQCRELLRTAGLFELLKGEQYDALITEDFENCGVGLSHLISPRALIPVSSTNLFKPFDFGVHYSAVTEHSGLMDGRFHSTLWSRLTNIYHSLVLCPAFFNTMNDPLQKVFDELYPGTPTFSSILSNAAVVFVNSDPLVDFARPSISKIVPIGGICVPTPKPLDDYWSGLLSLRAQTVLVSFGSIVKSVYMKPVRKAAILEAFASFPNTTFIWKYENKSDDFAKLEVSKHTNVMLTEWMPQTDILADPRLSLFISHGGMASCQELSHFGVPALLIPIFGDQTHNAGAVAHVGTAEVFSKFDLINSHKIRNAIGGMLIDTSYKSRALRIRDQLAARPTTPVERFVKNVEFAARFGPSKSLRPLNLELSTIQFLGLDILLVFVVSILLFIYIISLVLRLIRFFSSQVKVRKVVKTD